MEKVRKFKIEDGNVVMCCNNEYSGGEFVHVNDIELLLREEIRQFENMTKVRPPLDENSSEWDKTYDYNLREKIKLLNHLIEKLCYGK